MPGGQSFEDAERGGFIYFVSSDNVNVPQVQIQMPFIQLKRLNDTLLARNKAFFPSHVLFYPSPTRPWRWQDFEAMVPYIVSALLRAIAVQPVKSVVYLGSIFRGALASDLVLGYILSLNSLEVHFEAEQYEVPFPLLIVNTDRSPRFLKKDDDKPAVQSTISCQDGFDYDLHDGIFVCRTGNALIDFRLFLKSPNKLTMALFVQLNHSEWTVTNSKITFASIVSWYRKCQSALASYRSTFRVVLAMVTNRRIDFPPGCTPSESSWPQDLLVISHDELAAFLGPLAHRGLLAVQEDT